MLKQFNISYLFKLIYNTKSVQYKYLNLLHFYNNIFGNIKNLKKCAL